MKGRREGKSEGETMGKGWVMDNKKERKGKVVGSGTRVEWRSGGVFCFVFFRFVFSWVWLVFGVVGGCPEGCDG